jgi:16S rRNA (guanine527-N7)-methyltransferase
LSGEKLRQLVGLVATWSGKINLVSKGDLPLLWDRHVADSLALAPQIPAGTAFATDLGAGAGFPGLVLAIATGIPFTLIESDARKAAFLSEAARQLAAPVRVINARIETARTEPAPLVTARALAPLDRLIGLARPHLAAGGICLFPKGRTWRDELTAAEALWHMDVTRIPSPLDGDACILKLENIRHVGAA